MQRGCGMPPIQGPGGSPGMSLGIKVGRTIPSAHLLSQSVLRLCSQSICQLPSAKTT